MAHRRPHGRDPGERTEHPLPPGVFARARAGVEAFHVRDLWWRTLDFFEASRGRRLALYCAGVLLVAGVAARIFVYPRWVEHNAIHVAQQWLEAGQYRNAAEAAARATRVAPTQPEPWRIASELARLGGQSDQALQYARHAATLAPADAALGIGWAAAALNAGSPEEARTALARQSATALAASPEAQRILGELARQEVRLTEARDHFTAALELEGPKAINEVPLGLILLRSTDPAERQRGLDLLQKWTADLDWGPAALRALLGDALQRDDRAAMLRTADALRAHPRVTVSDMPTWLLALARADEKRYAETLAQLQRDHAVNPAAAAQLLGWLNQIGRSADAVAWMKTLPAVAMHRPPLAALGAEALRATGAWDELQAWTDGPAWDSETEFLRWTYGLSAALQRQDTAKAGELWRTLYSHGELNAGHALFAASTLYTWGITDQAVQLWWRAAEQDGSNAVAALGALARHYQVHREAEGLYRAFRRLHSLQPQDAAIANNFAFYALLLNREQRVAAQAARANAEQHPDNVDYVATHGFALVQQGRIADALTVLRPKASLAASSPGIAFAYGLALAANGEQTEARPILERIPPASLTSAEVELIKQKIGD